MGKGPKHKLNKSTRNNDIFKVVGVNMKDKKGKPKEVMSRIKSIAVKNKNKTLDLDATLKDLQHASVSAGKPISGSVKTSESVPASAQKAEPVAEQQMEDLADLLKTKS
eukprot:TRINITY_DN14679_c0_g1_i1.p1 TRINITY_DN14679_c0_g1~~TRINITY_DN14679_c0_g1_i1.p1  ORF type:complete len:109 (-),score=20.40 TRINITY_DN14679_c0_g1_i1:71-397(-)